MTPHATPQRIKALTPVAELESRFDSLVARAAPELVALETAIGKTLAENIIALADVPEKAVAAYDGWAVNAEQVLDASAYSPVVLSNAPLWVDTGGALPSGVDAVLPPDAATVIGHSAEVVAPIASAEGVLAARKHVAKGDILAREGDRLTPLSIAALRGLGVKNVSVRTPRVKIIAASSASDALDFVSPLVEKILVAWGGAPEIVRGVSLDALLERPAVELVVVIGGTGEGRNDATVNTLAQKGRLEFHGVGISPGHTAAFGQVGDCLVLALPGQLDAALSALLVVGRMIMTRLTGARDKDGSTLIKVTRKIASTIGLEEVIYVRHVEGGVEPLGKGMFPLQKLMLADGWICIAADSEGIPGGTVVEVRSLP